MRLHHAPALAVALSLVSLPAQAVTTSAVMGGATVSAQAGSLPPQVRTLTSGSPLPTSPVVAVQTSGGVALSTLSGSFVPLDTRVSLTLLTNTFTTGPAAASVVADALLTITPAAPVPVRIDLGSFANIASGSTAPILGVDFDNNGTIDFRGRVNATLSHNMVLTGPTTMRLHVEVQKEGPTLGSTQATTTLAIVPDHPTISVQQILSPCAEWQLDAEETFVPAVRLQSSYTPAANEFSALVIGFTPLFAPLPFGQNCFLLPSPDLILFGFGAGSPLDLPATIGPVGFYAQSVLFSPNAIGPQSSRGIFVTL